MFAFPKHVKKHNQIFEKAFREREIDLVEGNNIYIYIYIYIY